MAVIGPQPTPPSPPAASLVPKGGGGQLPQPPRPAPGPNIARPPSPQQQRPRDNAMSQDLMRFGLQRTASRQDWERAETTRKQMMKDTMQGNQMTAFLKEVSTLEERMRADTNMELTRLGTTVPAILEKHGGDVKAAAAEIQERTDAIMQGTWPAGSVYLDRVRATQDQWNITPEMDEKFGGVAGTATRALTEQYGGDTLPPTLKDWTSLKDASAGELRQALTYQASMDMTSLALSKQAKGEKAKFFKALQKSVATGQTQRTSRVVEKRRELLQGILGFEPAEAEKLLSVNADLRVNSNLAQSTKHNLQQLANLIHTDGTIRAYMAHGAIFNTEESADLSARTVPTMLARIFQPLGPSGGFSHAQLAYKLFLDPSADEEPFIKDIYGRAMEIFGGSLITKSEGFAEGKSQWGGLANEIVDVEAFKTLVAHVGTQLQTKGRAVQADATYKLETEELIHAMVANIGGFGELSAEEAERQAMGLMAKYRSILPGGWTPADAAANLRDLQTGDPSGDTMFGMGGPGPPDPPLPPPLPKRRPGPMGPPAPGEPHGKYSPESDDWYLKGQLNAVSPMGPPAPTQQIGPR